MKNTIKLTAWAMVVFGSNGLAAKVPTAVVNGNIDNRESTTVLTHATIHVDANTTLENASLVLQNDRIISVNPSRLPEQAVVKDYSGLHIYPGFIHLDATVGLPEPDKRPPFSWDKAETLNSTKEGAYNSNEAIKASFQAAKHFKTDEKTNSKLRAAGFTTALSHRKDGIMRGTSVLTHLADMPDELNILNTSVAQHYSFDKGSSKQDYPISLMGSVALIRQTWMDADWYQQQSEMVDFDLAAVNEHKQLPKIISTDNWQQTLLAQKIANEFNTRFVVRTSADSYQNLPAIKATGQTLIVPLSTPDAPAINDELDTWNVDFNDLKEWEVAPYNPALLEKNNITFALVPDDSKKGLDTFLKDLRKAHQKGLSEASLIKALTQVPASIVGDDRLGRIAANNLASFIVTDGPLLDDQTQISESWVAGQSYTVSGLPQLLPGRYQLMYADNTYGFDLSQEGGKYKLKSIDSDDPFSYELSPSGNFAQLNVKPKADKKDKDSTDEDSTDEDSTDEDSTDEDSTDEDSSDENTTEAPQAIELFGYIKDRQLLALDQQDWQLTKIADPESEHKEDEANAIQWPAIPSPFTAYGMAKVDNNDSVLIQNATVWTNEENGILENSDVLVVDGKIKQVGENISAPKGIKIIDGEGMHLTSGIIDEHSHIALLSVNDVAVNSSMVRMQDAVNPHDVNIYRNLSGGVTAAQLLHGSANPIGGQSALVKFRWGVQSPEDLLIDGADGYIKFALGENVKRSRSSNSIRYPLTRMGVEQVYRDAFTQARAYEKAWNDYNSLSQRKQKSTTAPRKDLAMDATLEVLNQDRFVSCHSYVQSEINMLMHVADDFGFNVNTFTHILEGYKVADKMHEHGVGGSTFADWWAYKWEVNYAIPYNAALMNNEGVVTAINSDSAEMSRRLNQEAAKTIKYGGLSEQDAWKMVTLNPAKLLHLDDRMGSIKVGKDADLVLWSDHPLSIYAKAEKTMIDGVTYFDRSQQTKIEQTIAAEKNRLIELSKNSGGKKSNTKSMPPRTFECESITGHQEFDQLFFMGAES